MTINKFKSVGEWRNIRGCLLAVFELTTPKLTTTSSALGHLSRTHSAYDLSSLKVIQKNSLMSGNDAEFVQRAIENYPV